MNSAKSLVPTDFYKPSELLNIFKNFLSNKEINATVLCLRGIYLMSTSEKYYNNEAYDSLRDENSPEEITIVVPLSLRNGLKNGNLISVYGTLDRKLYQTGSIQIMLRVSRVDKMKELAISEDEIKRAELRRKKESLGYKNVDVILENKLFVGCRPRVAIVYADTSITNADFEKGLAAAKSNIDFEEFRVSFANPTAFCSLISQLDYKQMDAIAIVRGGGSGLEKLDDIKIVEQLTNLNTAWIYGVGHEKENVFIKNIADKVIPIPFAVGTYFRDMVEAIVQKRNKSRAVLVQEVKKQYEKQIEDSNKKNQELTKQLEAMQKQNKEQAEASNKRIEALTKAQKEYQNQIKIQTEALNKANQEAQKMVKEQTDSLRKANETAQKQAKEQIEAAAKTNKELQEKLTNQGKTLEKMQEQQKKQQEDFNKSLGKMQETNSKLQESLNKVSAQNTQASKELMEAKARTKELEEQLTSARSTAKSSNNNILIVIIIIIAIIILMATIF